jgi:hypothetical protein
MVTDIQYPHILQIKDETGTFEAVSICCDQPNNKGQKQLLADGTFYEFQSIVYAPKNEFTTGLLVGQDIKVVGEMAETRLEDSIKRVSVDVFHVRVWI